MERWAIYADWLNNNRAERAWWVVDANYPAGALMQGAANPALFDTQEDATREAVKVALIVSDWVGGYDIGVKQVTRWLPPKGSVAGELIGEA